MPYQDFTAVHSVLSESSRAVYDMGCKLHTLLVRNACTNPEEDGNKRINLLTRWPAMILDQVGTTEIDTNIRTLRDFDTANGICRVLLTQLLTSFRDENKDFRSGFKINNSIQRNLVHITTQIEELIFSSHGKSIDLNTQDGDSQSKTDVNEQIFSWAQRDYLLYWVKSAGSE